MANQSNSVGALINIQLNGEFKQIHSPVSVFDIITQHELDPALIVVELNGHILDSDQYASTQLSENDSLELVRYIGGGQGLLVN